INEELERNRYPLFSTPLRAEEVNRNQSQLPEYIEYERVVGQEDTHKPGLREHHEAVERICLLNLFVPVGNEHYGHHDSGKQAKHAAHTIGSEAEVGT